MGQFHMTVNSGAGIPAAVGLHAGVYHNGNTVFLPVIQAVGNIHRKGGIPVMMQLYKAAVDGNRCVHHGSVKFQENLLSFPFCRNLQILRISGCPFGKIAHGRSRRCIRFHITFDHVIMRQVYFFAKTSCSQCLHQHYISLLK